EYDELVRQPRERMVSAAGDSPARFCRRSATAGDTGLLDTGLGGRARLFRRIPNQAPFSAGAERLYRGHALAGNSDRSLRLGAEDRRLPDVGDALLRGAARRRLELGAVSAGALRGRESVRSHVRTGQSPPAVYERPLLVDDHDADHPDTGPAHVSIQGGASPQ